MIYSQSARIISIAIIVIGLIVMVGWFTDDDSLKRLNPDWVTMKFSTATSFLMSGIILLLMNESRNKNSEIARIVLFAPLIIVSFFMATLLISTVLGTESGVSQLFVKENPSDVLRLDKAGMPSVGTMINFTLIIGAGFTYILTHSKHKKYLTICGGIILALGIVALLGYAIETPVMYYGVEEVSGAMALHTAVAFSLLGISLIFLSKPKHIEQEVKKKRFGLKISTKLIFAFLVSSLFPIIVVGLVSFDLAQSNLEKEYFSSTNEHAKLTASMIESNFFDRKADALVTAEADLFKNEIPILNQHYIDPSRSEYIKSDDHVDERLKIIRESYGYDNIMLLNTEGTIIFVSRDSSKQVYLGESFFDIDPKTFNEGKNGVYLSLVIPDIGGDGTPELYISAPIFNFDESFLGVLVFDIPIENFLERTVKINYIGNTGEVLLGQKVGEYAIFLHSLRFDPDAGYNKQIHLQDNIAQPIRESVQGIEGTGYSLDYRGEPIIASWKYIPDLNLGLVSKVDTKEAFESIIQLQHDITILAIVFIVGVTVFGISTSRSIAHPIIKLKNLSMKISKGKLDSKVTIQSSDEIGDLSEMMNETAIKLKNTQKEKEEFVAMITHDLKQPLVPISGNAEMLKNPKMGELNEMQIECVDEIAANASKQLSMIDNLVSAQKLGAGAMKYEIEELSTKELLKEAIKTHTPAMTDKNIEYFESSTEDIKIKGNKRRILEAFTNLILNAHDFVPENGKIEIGVKDGDKEVTFFCKDNGEGIPKEKQDQLFKKYGQVKSGARRKFGGTGLGLAVSQELVEGMGGKIWLKSEQGKGSTFLFTIPKV